MTTSDPAGNDSRQPRTEPEPPETKAAAGHAADPRSAGTEPSRGTEPSARETSPAGGRPQGHAEPWVKPGGFAAAGEPWARPDMAESGAESWAPLTEPPPPPGHPAHLTVIPDPTPYAMLDPTPEPARPQPAGSSPDETPTAPQPRLTAPAPPPPAWSTPETQASAPPIGGGGSATPPPYAGGPPPPPPPPGRLPDRRIWLIIGAAASLLICNCVAATAIALAWGGDLYQEIRSRSQRSVGLNQPARDGSLEFRVTGVQCGIDRVGDPFVNQAAVGQFCVAELAVRNLGRRPVIFTDSLQAAYGSSGEQFRADSTAGLLANADRPVFLHEINPGNQVTGAIVYDVPPNSHIVRLKLHESARSRGVIVKT